MQKSGAQKKKVWREQDENTTRILSQSSVVSGFVQDKAWKRKLLTSDKWVAGLCFDKL